MTKLTTARLRLSSGASIQDVAETLRRLRDEIRNAAGEVDRTGEGGASVANMRAYLALRRHDNRALQAALARLVLSSLGRSEAHVLATVEQVLEIVELLAADAPTVAAVPAAAIAFDESSDLLRRRTKALFGERPKTRETRIMVTLPSEASSDDGLVRSLVEARMDCARINSAHDDVASADSLPEAGLPIAADALGLDLRHLADVYAQTTVTA